jgi:anti-sigma regulatory factor (Ser/Thr protein kinase)
MSFSMLQEANFFGRTEELSGLLRAVNAAVKGQAGSVVLSGPPGMGKTELLKQLFGHLFWKQERIVPFYYKVNPALLSVAAFSKDYLSQFLCQQLAFVNREQFFLTLDGISLDELSTLVEEREAVWARGILDRYLGSTGDPIDGLRIALGAPRLSALATGMPIAVLIDEFHRLKNLRIDGVADPQLVSLLETPMSFGKTPHVLTGNAAEIHEMPVAGGLERIQLSALGPEDASSAASSLIRVCQGDGEAAPLLLLRHLGGNPFYLSCVLRRACAKDHPEAADYWKAYAAEIAGGSLSQRWTAVLKAFFPELGTRSIALTAAYKISHAKEPLSRRRIAKALALSEEQAEEILRTLYLAGFVRGAFGVFRAVDDRVVQDVLDYLYRSEVLGKEAQDLEGQLVEKSLPRTDEAVRFDMTLPMTKDAELVAAQCLEQIGKNLQLNRDAVGQVQIAVIEACINAIEHSKGDDRNIYMSVVVEGDRLEIGIESPGQEFVMQETGEPYDDKKAAKAHGRGWGIKLMKRFVDEVRFEKTARGTKTVLVKKFVKTADTQKEKSRDRE